MTPAHVALMLASLRAASVRSRFDAGLPVVAIEALLWIASGVDHLTWLQAVMELSPAQANRTLSLLRGRGRLRNGGWVESRVGLVSVTAHPHRRGYRILLTKDAESLLGTTFSGLPIRNPNTPGEQ